MASLIIQKDNNVTKVPQIARGTFVLVCGGLIIQVISGITGIIIARSLGLAQYGQYIIALNLATMFEQTFLLGLDAITTRETARFPSDSSKILPSALLPASLWSIIIIFLIIGLSSLLHYSNNIEKIILLVAPMIALRSITNLVRSFFRGLHRMELDVLVQTIEFGGGLIFICLILHNHPYGLDAALAILISEIIALVFAIIIVRRVIGPYLVYVFKMSITMIAAGIPLGITFTLLTYNLRLDTFILTKLSTEEDVGAYAAAFGMVLLIRPIFMLLSASLLPSLSAFVDKGSKELEDLLKKGLRYSLIIGVFIGTCTSLLAPFLIYLLFGDRFMGGVIALRILGPVSLLLGLNTYLWQVLFALRRTADITKVAIIGVFITTILGLLLIQKWGILGAALTAGGREISNLIGLSYFIFKKKLTINIHDITPPIIACIVLIVLLWPIRLTTYLWGVIFYIPVVLVIYLFVLLATKGIKQEEIMVFKKLLFSPFSTLIKRRYEKK